MMERIPHSWTHLQMKTTTRLPRISSLVLVVTLYISFAEAQASCQRDLGLPVPGDQDLCNAAGTQLNSCIGNSGAAAVPEIQTMPEGVYGPESHPGCLCTIPSYNLWSACAACQVGEDETPWLSTQEWMSRCSGRPQDDQIFTDFPWVTTTYVTFDVQQALVVQLQNTGAGATSLLPNSTRTPLFQPVGSSTERDSNPTAEANSAEGGGKKSNNMTAIIAGSVVGAVVLLGILFAILIFRRRRASKRVAPSSEFARFSHSKNLTRSRIGVLPGGASLDPEHHPMQEYKDNDSTHIVGQQQLQQQLPEPEPLPAFTPGLFKDPIFEKGAAISLATDLKNYNIDHTRRESEPVYTPFEPASSSGLPIGASPISSSPAVSHISHTHYHGPPHQSSVSSETQRLISHAPGQNSTGGGRMDSI